MHVRGKTRIGIPSYTLRGYSVELLDPKGVATGDPIILPDLRPGDPFNVVFNLDGTDIDRILIKRPNGYIASEFKF